MYRKISIVAYLNIVIVLLIGIMHEQIEAVSNQFLFIILVGYAVLNGLYIQRELLKQKKLAKGLESERQLSTLILESIPSGIIIINPKGQIEYVNDAVEFILGSSETVGENILNFDTVINSGLSTLITDAFSGKKGMLKEVKYTSFTSRKTLYLNFEVRPMNYNKSLDKYEAMLIINDITEEIFLKEKVEGQYFSLFKSFAKFIDAKDAYTGKHSNNVSLYVDLMLVNSELESKDKHDIRIAAALHDIGKIGITEHILNKPGKLTLEEYEMMKTHPVIGADLLEEIEEYKNIAQIIRHHHEHWNGHGYPDQLESNQIPMGSQMIAIADTYDAITSDRIYRNSRSHSVAIDILRAERGNQFNAELVDQFILGMDSEKKSS